MLHCQPDIIKPKLYNQKNRNYLKPQDNIYDVKFSSKRIKLINLQSIINNTDVTSSVNSSVNFPTPVVVDNLSISIQPTIFNLARAISEVIIDYYFSDLNYFPYNCGNSTDIDIIMVML